MDHAHYALRLVLLLKLRMMQYATQMPGIDTKGNQKLKKSAIRVSLGVGKMRAVDTKKGILDGEAVYQSAGKGGDGGAD